MVPPDRLVSRIEARGTMRERQSDSICRHSKGRVYIINIKTKES